MKYIINFALLLACVVYVQSQENCPGRPISQVCSGPRDDGYTIMPLCFARAQEMYYYVPSTRNCFRVNYRGCGGNGNRYCSVDHCQRACRR